jgi:hypothetical protein
MKTTAHSLLLAGLLAAAGIAQAQTAAATSDVPVKAGEASTMTQGQPNMATTNNPATEAPVGSAAQVRAEAQQNRTGAAATVSTPAKAGEASTMVQGRPNADVNAPTLGKSRAEVRAERELNRAQKEADKNLLVMGNSSARAGDAPGTPATAPAGTPSVFEGGTPK